MIGGVSTILPGLNTPSGSNVRFTVRNALYNVVPNIFSVNAPRTRPSPCSPESAPPNSSTRSAMSLAIASKRRTPSTVLRFTTGRTWRQPTDACA